MAIINGGSGDDALTGTKAADKIFGFAGSDFIEGLAGDDELLVVRHVQGLFRMSNVRVISKTLSLSFPSFLDSSSANSA